MDPSGSPDQMPQTPPQTPPPSPDWGQPGQPVGWGQPGQPAGAWAAPAPAPRRSRFAIAIGGVLVVLLIGGGLFTFSYMQAHKDAGKVVFSTDKPVVGETTGCSPGNQLTSIKVGTPVYATYVFSARQGSETVSLTVTKNGAEYLPATDLATSDTNGSDCFSETTDLSQVFEAGAYKFTLASGGKTIAEGTLTVTP